jgi:hypothetical protein
MQLKPHLSFAQQLLDLDTITPHVLVQTLARVFDQFLSIQLLQYKQPYIQRRIHKGNKGEKEKSHVDPRGCPSDSHHTPILAIEE